MGLFGSFGKVTYYFFSKEETDSLEGIPPGYEIMFNERSGIPLLRKTSKKKAKEKYSKEMAKQ
jgi:hypothetical protein